MVGCLPEGGHSITNISELQASRQSIQKSGARFNMDGSEIAFLTVTSFPSRLRESSNVVDDSKLFLSLGRLEKWNELNEATFYRQRLLSFSSVQKKMLSKCDFSCTFILAELCWMIRYNRSEDIMIKKRFCSLYSHIVSSIACTHTVFRQGEVESPRAGLVNILFGTGSNVVDGSKVFL